MAGPILVVDFGLWGTSAAIVSGDRVALVGDPTTGSLRWPSAAFGDGEQVLVGGAAHRRRDVAPLRYVDGVRGAIDGGEPVWLGDRQVAGTELLAAYLRTIIAESERAQAVRIERLALAVPAGYRTGDHRRELMVTAAAAAGFPGVELVSDAAAAVLDPRIGADFPDGALVLVCDLGTTWNVALVRAARTHPVQLAEDASRGGRDFDLMLLSDLRAALHEWIEPILASGGEDASRLYYAAADFVRRLKHELDDADEVADRLTPSAPQYHLDRAALERFAEPGLRWMLGTCRAVVARAGESLANVHAVLLVGGASRLTVARTMLQAGLGRPVVHVPEPELAVTRGAARWAATAEHRRVPAQRARWRVEPLCWELPEGGGRLVRWLVGENEAYPAGGVLAQVRTSDDRVYDLIAPRRGVLVERRLTPGSAVPSGVVAATTRSDTAMAGGSPVKRYELRATGEWLLTPDLRVLIESADNGGYVKVRSVVNGAVLSELRPSYESQPRWGRVFRSPAGQFTQVACDNDGRFFVWDLATGRRLVTFREAGPPTSVLVDEAHWRLVAETGKKAQVGRYRRDVATVWDLTTGTRVDELVGEDLQRLTGGYADRGTANALATEMVSGDRRLRAVAVPASAGVAVALHEVETGQELFRADRPAAESMRTAIDADGRHLLAYWRSADLGCIEVWEI